MTLHSPAPLPLLEIRTVTHAWVPVTYLTGLPLIRRWTLHSPDTLLPRSDPIQTRQTYQLPFTKSLTLQASSVLTSSSESLK